MHDSALHIEEKTASNRELMPFQFGFLQKKINRIFWEIQASRNKAESKQYDHMILEHLSRQICKIHQGPLKTDTEASRTN